MKTTPSTHPTRREVLRTGATAAAGTLLAPWATAGSSRGRQATLRVGLVGCGGRGTGAAAQALRADEDTELVALGDAFELIESEAVEPYHPERSWSERRLLFRRR